MGDKVGGLSDKVYDHSAEHGLVALLLQHPDKVVEAALALKEDSFALPIPKAIFKLIKHLVSEGQTLDTLRIISEAQKFPQIYRYLGEEQAFANIEALRSVDTDIDSFDAFIESIKKHYIARQMIDGSEKLRQKVYDSYQRETSDSLLSIAQEFGTKLAVDNQSRGNILSHMGTGLTELVVRDVPADGITGIHTMYPTLDRITLGLQPKETYTIVAQSGEGKSVLLKCLSTRIAIVQRIPTLYLDTEMDRESQQHRMLSELSDVPELDIKNGKYRNDKSAVERVTQAKRAIENGCLYHKEITDFSIEQVVNLCRYAVMTLGVKVIVYDYIKIPDSFSGDEREHVWLGKMTSALKNEVAKELNVAVLTAAQSDQNDPRHVADSARIKRYSSFLAYWMPTNSGKGTHVFDIDKNRFGPRGCIYFNFNKPYLKIEEGKNGSAEQLTALPLNEGDASDSSRQDKTKHQYYGFNGKLRSNGKGQQELSLSSA